MIKKRDLKNIKKYIQNIEDAFQELFSASIGYSKLKSAIEELEKILNNSKFKENDRVKLIKDLDIPKESGWYHSKHFLTKNSPGKIEEIEIHNGKYYYGVVFDNDSYIDIFNTNNIMKNQGSSS